MDYLKSYISKKLSEEVISIKSVSGGDISSAYRIETSTDRYFLKVNGAPFAQEMFLAEQKGLQAIEETKSIAVPYVHLTDTFEGKSFLLMDFVESKRPNKSDFQRLGTQLASLHQWSRPYLEQQPQSGLHQNSPTDLHQCTQTDLHQNWQTGLHISPQTESHFSSHTGLPQGSKTGFGFPSDNFIGSLPQSNHQYTDWPQFYWLERILPQLQLAHKSGLIQPQIIPKEEKALTLFQEILCNEIPGDVQPSLLHGDLWGGNFHIATDGTPYLIDPATYFGHSMVDIAMSRLFGGFSPAFYDAYHEIIPKTVHYDTQIELYQLYYLLVHLNLFGSGYYSSVESILKRFFENIPI